MIEEVQHAKGKIATIGCGPYQLTVDRKAGLYRFRYAVGTKWTEVVTEI